MFDLERLDAEILEAVRAEWKNHEVPLLFSHLGLARLSGDARAYVKENGITLKRHVRTRLSDQLRVVPMAREGGGIVPVDETEGRSDVELERAYAVYRADKRPDTKRIRFDEQVWNAFVDPMPAESRRVFSFVNGRPSVRLAGKAEAVPEGEIPIESSDIDKAGSTTGAPNYEAVYTAIRAWATNHGVDILQLGVETQPRPRNSANVFTQDRSRWASSHAEGFIEILRSLPKTQLARLEVPGDVVLSILELVVRR